MKDVNKRMRFFESVARKHLVGTTVRSVSLLDDFGVVVFQGKGREFVLQVSAEEGVKLSSQTSVDTDDEIYLFEDDSFIIHMVGDYIWEDIYFLMNSVIELRGTLGLKNVE